LYLFVFEFLGTTELMVILVVALIVFGPRKLPQLSRSLGKSLSEFRRASDDFKRTWEREVALEDVSSKPIDAAKPTSIPPMVTPAEYSIGRDDGFAAAISEPTATDSAATQIYEPAPAPAAESVAPAEPAPAKRDWL
jgi:TatA/E family protein of Tat protein translocase